MKTLPRVKELRISLGILLTLSNERAPKLSERIWKTTLKARNLAKTIRGKDKKLEAELFQLQGRIQTIYNKVQEIIAGNRLINDAGIPKAPKLSSDLSLLIGILVNIDNFVPNKMIERTDMAIADRQKAISDAEGAVAAGAFAAKNAPDELKRAMECYASFKKTTGEAADKGDINEVEITVKIEQIIEASKDADTLWKNQQVKAKLAESSELCDQAGSIRQKIPGSAESAEKAEKKVNRRLAGAAAIAKKCPDVKNPQDITRLYDLAKQLTVQIGAEVVMVKKESAALAEKISLAKIERADAIKEAAALKGAIAEKYNMAKPIWKSISVYKMRLSTQPEFLDIFPEAYRAMLNLKDLSDKSQSLFAEVNRSPQCNVQPADDIVARAENAYTGALVSFGAGKDLPSEAAACLAKAAGITLPKVEGMSYDKAVAAIKGAELKVLRMELGSPTAVKEMVGKAEKAVPEHNGPLQTDDGVTLYLYGEEIVSNKVPNVIGQQLAKASAAVKKAGLNLIIELGDETNNPKKEGTIYSQAPVAGSEVGAGANVTLLVYNFIAETYVVPNVLGLQLASARDAVKQAGFKPILELGEETGDPEKDGAIARQAPAPGTEIEAGRDVTLFIYTLAAEAQEVTLPDVEGKIYEKAVRLINNAGLLVSLPPALGKLAKNPDMVGRVEFALPAVDGQLHVGDKVTLYLYGKVEEVGNVPYVIGMELREAMDVVELAGFNPVIEVGKETADSKKEGTIYDQGPRPGYSLEPGRDVVLEVYIQSIATTPVPRLKGLSQRRARQALKDVGLFVNLNKGKAAPTSSDQGMVYKQYPKPGFEVMSGIGIDIWVYREAEEVETDVVVSSTDYPLTGGVPFIDVPRKILSFSFAGTYFDEWDVPKTFNGGRLMRPSSAGIDNQLFKDLGIHAMTFCYSSGVCFSLGWLEPNDSITQKNTTEMKHFCSKEKDKVHIRLEKDGNGVVDYKYATLYSRNTWVAVMVWIPLPAFDLEASLIKKLPEWISQLEPYAKHCKPN